MVIVIKLNYIFFQFVGKVGWFDVSEKSFINCYQVDVN